MSDLPSSPWTEVSMDFSGSYPICDYLVVLMDEYSRFPIVENIRSTSATSVIPHLERIFAIFGILAQLKTDNGPPFNSHELALNTIPVWPKANAEAERFTRTLGKTIKAATVAGKSWKKELSSFLQNYRATPHSITGVAPATIMFGRSIRTKLPQVDQQPDDSGLCQRDSAKKQKMKDHADKRAHASPTQLQVGTRVLVRQPVTSKTTTPYSAQPYTIVRIKGSMLAIRDIGSLIIRLTSNQSSQLSDLMRKTLATMKRMMLMT